MENLKPNINSIFYNPKNLNYCEMIINDEKPSYIRYDEFKKYITEYIDEESKRIIIYDLIKKWKSFVFFTKTQKVIQLELNIDTVKKELKTGKIIQGIKKEIKTKHTEFYKKRFDPKEKAKNIWKKDINYDKL